MQLYYKRDSGTGVLLWILRNLQGHIFLLNTSGWVLLHFSFSIDYHELSVTSFPHSPKIWWMFRKQKSKASLNWLNVRAAVCKCSTEMIWRSGSTEMIWRSTTLLKKRPWYRWFPGTGAFLRILRNLEILKHEIGS